MRFLAFQRRLILVFDPMILQEEEDESHTHVDRDLHFLAFMCVI